MGRGHPRPSQKTCRGEPPTNRRTFPADSHGSRRTDRASIQRARTDRASIQRARTDRASIQRAQRARTDRASIQRAWNIRSRESEPAPPAEPAPGNRHQPVGIGR